MKSVRFHDCKLESIKTWLFLSIHETEDLTEFYCLTFICGRDYRVPGPRNLMAP